MKQVLVRHGEITQIGKMFDVSIVTVRAALRGQTKSVLSRKIRKVAIDRGGKES